MNAFSLQAFGNHLVDQDKSERTITGYVDDLRHFSRWYEQSNGEELRPDRLTPTDVKQYRAFLQTAQARPATVNRRLAALRAYGKAAKDLGLAENNPANGIRGVKEQKMAPKWLDKQEQARLTREVERRCQNAKTEPARRQAARDKAIVVLLLNTGLRIGELSALEIGDINLAERKGELRVRNGKGGKDRRIPLNRDARKALQEWSAARPETATRLVFTGQRSEGLKRRAIQTRLEELGEAAKVEGVSPHVFRHTFAKNLVDVGVSLEKVAMLLGHTNLNTTKIYITPGMVDLEKAVAMLED